MGGREGGCGVRLGAGDGGLHAHARDRDAVEGGMIHRRGSRVYTRDSFKSSAVLYKRRTSRDALRSPRAWRLRQPPEPFRASGPCPPCTPS